MSGHIDPLGKQFVEVVLGQVPVGPTHLGGDESSARALAWPRGMWRARGCTELSPGATFSLKLQGPEL